MKRILVIALAVVALVLTVAVAVIFFSFEDVTDYQLAECTYTGIQRSEERDSSGRLTEWVDDHNLTETAMLFSGSNHAKASRMIETIEEYDAFVDRIETKIDGVIQEIGDYEKLFIISDDLEEPIDAKFFETHNILVIDFCGINVANQSVYLSGIKRSDLLDLTVATVEYTIYDGSAEDRLGDLYWIAIPKEYGEIKVIFKKGKPMVMDNDLGGL